MLIKTPQIFVFPFILLELCIRSSVSTTFTTDDTPQVSTLTLKMFRYLVADNIFYHTLETIVCHRATRRAQDIHHSCETDTPDIYLFYLLRCRQGFVRLKCLFAFVPFLHRRPGQSTRDAMH